MNVICPQQKIKTIIPSPRFLNVICYHSNHADTNKYSKHMEIMEFWSYYKTVADFELCQ